jgi:Protein of unknown function (DUF3175)
MSTKSKTRARTKAARKSSKRRTSSESSKARKTSKKRWSGKVTRNSDALDLQEGVFTRKDPKSIARSLKRSAEASHRRKSDPYRSAMSMLSFYINRGGDQLTASRRKTLESAKQELRRLFGRT